MIFDKRDITYIDTPKETIFKHKFLLCRIRLNKQEGDKIYFETINPNNMVKTQEVFDASLSGDYFTEFWKCVAKFESYVSEMLNLEEVGGLRELDIVEIKAGQYGGQYAVILTVENGVATNYRIISQQQADDMKSQPIYKRAKYLDIFTNEFNNVFMTWAEIENIPYDFGWTIQKEVTLPDNIEFIGLRVGDKVKTDDGSTGEIKKIVIANNNEDISKNNDYRGKLYFYVLTDDAHEIFVTFDNIEKI
jgi:hypothetical protein